MNNIVSNFDAAKHSNLLKFFPNAADNGLSPDIYNAYDTLKGLSERSIKASMQGHVGAYLMASQPKGDNRVIGFNVRNSSGHFGSFVQRFTCKDSETQKFIDYLNENIQSIFNVIPKAATQKGNKAEYSKNKKVISGGVSKPTPYSAAIVDEQKPAVTDPFEALISTIKDKTGGNKNISIANLNINGSKITFSGKCNGETLPLGTYNFGTMAGGDIRRNLRILFVGNGISFDGGQLDRLNSITK